MAASPAEQHWKVVPRCCVYGFLYWAAFLMVLEPDNVLRAVREGYRLSFDHEAVRILGAALVGAAVTPALLAITARLPVSGASRWLNVLLHVSCAAAVAFALIVISCFLAAWGFERRWLPSIGSVRDELLSNWALLIFALAFFMVIANRLRHPRVAYVAPKSQAPVDLPERFMVKSRGRSSFVDSTSIDWVETQGNYVALHVGSRQHLIRDTLTNFETQLDARRFVRIHRRAMVAIPKIQDLRAEGNGDATLRLIDGVELRVSRRFRKTVRERWATATRS